MQAGKEEVGKRAEGPFLYPESTMLIPHFQRLSSPTPTVAQQLKLEAQYHSHRHLHAALGVAGAGCRQMGP